jgi:hypothetical protein
MDVSKSSPDPHWQKGGRMNKTYYQKSACCV